MAIKQSKMGRPRKEINKTEFEGLLQLQCTKEEVAAFFDHMLGGCSVDTIERWCKEEYGETFAAVSAKKRDLGRISLRRIQFQHAKKNASMAIFLGKNYLGQSDKVEAEDTTALDKLDAILKSMKETADADADVKPETE